MRPLFIILWVLFSVELIAAGGWAAMTMAQPAPLLPSERSVDADTWTDLDELQRRIARNGSSDNWLDLADALAGKGFYANAEIAYRQSFALNSHSVAAREGIAFCEDRTGRIQESNRTYTDLLVLATGETRQRVLYALGRNALRLEQADTAKERFKENLDFIPARYMSCKLLVDSGRVRDAKPLVEAFLRTLPRSLLFQRLQYQICTQLNDSEGALAASEALERSLLLFPVNIQVDAITERNERYGFRHLFSEYQKYAEYLTPPQKQATLLDLQEHLRGELSAYSIVITKSLAEAAVENRDISTLKSALDQLGEWGIHDASTRELRGDAHALAEDAEAAASDWETSVTMMPTIQLHDKLSKHYASIGNTAQAQAHRQLATLLEAQKAYHDDQLDRSLELVKQAVAADENNAWSWYLLCQVQRAKRNAKEAERAFQQYVALSPSELRQK